MKELRYRFNTWEAYGRCIGEITTFFGDKSISGDIFLPEHFKITSWKDLDKVIIKLIKYNPLRSGWIKLPTNYKDIYGEIWVEIK